MRRLISFAALAAVLATPGLASAGIYTDDMSKCLVKSTTAADQAQLVSWIFSAMSVHPAVRPMSNLTDAQRDASTKKAGLLMQRLMTEDCRKETVAAIKYEGVESISQAFGVLGQVAMRGLMSDPGVAAGMAKLGDNIDETKFDTMFKEAGVTPPAAK